MNFLLLEGQKAYTICKKTYLVMASMKATTFLQTSVHFEFYGCKNFHEMIAHHHLDIFSWGTHNSITPMQLVDKGLMMKSDVVAHLIIPVAAFQGHLEILEKIVFYFNFNTLFTYDYC